MLNLDIKSRGLNYTTTIYLSIKNSLKHQMSRQFKIISTRSNKSNYYTKELINLILGTSYTISLIQAPHYL